MTKANISDAALEDLWLIGECIGKDNIQAARKLVDNIDACIHSITNQPSSGSPCDELSPGLRYVIHKSYVIYYDIHDDQVVIARILHGSRDHRKLFKPEQN